MNKTARKISILLAAALAAGSMTACSASTGSGVAKYGSEEISADEAEFWLRYEQWTNEAYYWDMYTTYFGYDNMWDMTYSDTQTYGDYLHDNIMSQILQTRICMEHEADYSIDGLTEDQTQKVEDAVDSFLEAYPNFADVVSADRDAMVEYMTKNAEASLVIQAVKDNADIEVTDDECNSYKVEYIEVTEPTEDETEASDETEAAEETEAADTLEGMELANEVLKEAEAGTEMSDIADTYSLTCQDATYLVTGEESTDIPYTASADLAAGEISLAENDAGDGWYIVKRVNDLDEDATADKRDSVTEEKKTEAFNTLYAEWSDSAKKFTVNEDKWDEITITDKIYSDPSEETEAAAETEAAETEAAETEAQ